MKTEGLAEAYDRYARPLYRFLCGFLGNTEDAADALQTVFVGLARRGLDGISDLEDYLWTASRHQARRIAGGRRTRFLEPRNGHAPDPIEREAVEAALLSLPEDLREVVILHVLEGLTFREVSSRLRISPNTAAGRYRQAREKLKEFLK